MLAEAPSDRRLPPAVRRAAVIGGNVALLVFTVVVSEGHPSGLLRRGPFSSDFFDAQAHALLDGHLDVDPSVAGIEGFVHDGRTHLYFGLAPALLRLPIAALTDRFDGRLGQLSMLVALSVAMAAAARLVWRARRHRRGGAAVARWEPWIVGGFTAAVGLSSPLLFLASRPVVYHETELWGAATTLVALEATLAWWERTTARGLALASLAAAVAFVWHERRTPDPVLPLRVLRPSGAWGAMLVNLLVGVALVAALVNIPLFARNTTTPGDQFGAALVLLRLLVAVPVGAVAGGWLCRTVAPRLVASGGMALACAAFVAMTRWDERSLDGGWSFVVLLLAGLGFGLAIAPVNAVLLAVTGSDVHGTVSALAVVARTVGMLTGLSLLTAVALRRFNAEVDSLESPFELCPQAPGDCPAYDALVDAAILTQLHTVFAGAAIAAGLAALAALLLLREVRTARPARPA